MYKNVSYFFVSEGTTIDDLLPTEKIDKASMVREWIKVQSSYALRSKSKKQITN
jgi:hypothetical protein